MKDVILKHLEKMEFVCGLKQFREYSKENALELIDCLESQFKSMGWMTEERVDYILRAGMRGHYGEFYHVNEKTVSGWISQYYNHHQSTIIQEIQAMNNQEEEKSPEEIAMWIEIGKDIFRENYRHAKETGSIRDLGEWGPNYFGIFQEKGILKPWLFPVEEIEADVRKELRLVQKYVDQVSVGAKARNRIWKLFIRESIEKNLNLDQLI